MLIKMYKVTNQYNQEKYFNDADHAVASLSSHDYRQGKGAYVYCFKNTAENSYHEVAIKYSGKKTDAKQLIKEGTLYYGGNEYLEINDIKTLSDGFYDACLSMHVYGDNEFSSGDKKYSIQLNESTELYSKEKVIGDYTKEVTYGLILSITDNTYTLYTKLNQFIPEPTVELTHTYFQSQRSQSNMTLFTTPAQEEKANIPIMLTEEERQYLATSVVKAKEKAMKEILSARLRHQSLRQ